MPRRRRPTAYATVRAQLAAPWMADPGHLEGIAAEVHREAHLLDPFDIQSGEALAMSIGCLVLRSPAAVCGAACLLSGVLTVRPDRCDLVWNFNVLHEVAHRVIEPHEPHHSHADVWALTLALAVPRGHLRRIEEARHVPAWALRLRRQTSRAIPRAA